MKKTLAIVTSYSELCGNAEYSDALRVSLEKHFDVSIVALNTDLLQSGASTLANQHIKEVAEQVKKFDFVNIQFEAGLFGIHPRSIFSRFKHVAQASKRLTVTMHRVDLASDTFKKLGKTGLGISALLRAFLYDLRTRNMINLYKKVIQLCAKSDSAVIVHTKRERTRVESYCPNVKVFDHPLTYYTPEQTANYRAQFVREDFIQKYNLNKDKYYIGLFGFLSPYKATDVVIKSLEFLPDDYEILLFGSQHPQSIRYSPTGDPYIITIVRSLENKGPEFQSRVRFLGNLFDHNAMIQALICCDMAVLPYNEVGQSGSGIAALILDLKLNALFAQNLAILELAKYATNALELFSIGNYIELAQKIMWKRQNRDTLSYLDIYNKQYNADTNALLYKQAFESTRFNG